MKTFTLFILLQLLLIICAGCDDENQEILIKDENRATFSAEDSLTQWGWLELFPVVKKTDTVECDTETYMSVMDSTVSFITYIIEDMCAGENSSFVERPDPYREISEVIADGRRFVGTYQNNFASRYLICKGNSGIGCGYSIRTYGINTLNTPVDTLQADSISCNSSYGTIYINATDYNVTVKVIILEKCQSGTLDIIVKTRDYTPLTHNFRVNQIPSTTTIKLEKNSFIQLKSFGTGGRVVYKLVIPWKVLQKFTWLFEYWN